MAGSKGRECTCRGIPAFIILLLASMVIMVTTTTIMTMTTMKRNDQPAPGDDYGKREAVLDGYAEANDNCEVEFLCELP